MNLTNHAYFNLDGHKAWGKLDNHSIQLNALAYTPVDGDAIPIGEMRNVSGSAFDLTSSGKNIQLGIFIILTLSNLPYSSAFFIYSSMKNTRNNLPDSLDILILCTYTLPMKY